MKEFELNVIQQSLLSSMSYFMKNSLTEIKRRFCYYFLSLISVTVVVCAAQITQTVTDRSQFIYLQAGELQNGQIDMRILPSIEYIKLPFNRNRKEDRALLNYTSIQERLKISGLDQLSAPRTLFDANITVVSEANKCGINSTISLSEYPDIFKQCSKYITTNMIFMDTEIERNVGIGRLYDVEEIPEGQVVISKEMAQLHSIQEGATILVQFKPTIYYFYLVEKYCSEQISTSQACANTYYNFEHYNFQIAVAFTVFKIVDGNNIGKTPYDEYKNTIFAETKYLQNIFKIYTEQQLKEYIQVISMEGFSYDIGIQQYATEILLNFPNRIEFYTQKNMDLIEVQGNWYGQEVAKLLGVYPIGVELPILKLFHKLKYAQMFLSTVTNMVIILFSALSIMMLYNLLLVSVETKTYELGVLRIIGLNKFGVIAMIISQSLSYVFPGVILGIVIAIQILKYASQQFKEIIGIQLDQSPTLNSYALCLLLGIVIPLASSIIPIKRALGNTLSFALDKERSKCSAVKITIDTDGKKINWGQISFGVLCTLFGFSIYYLLPLSLFQMDIGLLITIFFFILIGLLIGLILICVNFSYLFERLVVFVCFFWMADSSKKLVLKNLACHRIKNTRTSIMYGLSIAFVIFVWSAMTLQIDSQYYHKLQDKGANFVISDSIPNQNIQQFENIFQTDLKDIVKSYTFVAGSAQLSLGLNGISTSLSLKNRGQLIELRTNVIGVQPNYLETTGDQFLKIERKSSSGLDIVKELYTSKEVGKMIISKEYAEQLFYKTDINLEDGSQENIVYLQFEERKKIKVYKFQVSAIVSSFPGMKMTSDINEDPYNHVIVSIPSFYSLISDLPLDETKQVFDKIIFDADLQYDDIILRKLMALTNYQIKGLWSFKSSYQELESNTQLINLIFSGLGVLVMVLCFFSLISSMTANIFEQTKEIAILRAIGLGRFRLSLIYIYESFVLVFSSCIMGTLVGLFIGYSMSMQRQLFTQMTIKYRFPWVIFETQFIVSIICAFGSTLIPITHIIKQPISNIIRKTF